MLLCVFSRFVTIVVETYRPRETIFMHKLILFLGFLSGITPSIVAINETCSTDQDCKVQEKSVCLNDHCTCDYLSYYQETKRKCLKYVTEYDEFCLESEQCHPFLGANSQCDQVSNRCSCISTYKWYQGTCRKYSKKGESCIEQDTICLDAINPLALHCSNSTGMCECADGYYDRGGDSDCRKISYIDLDCAISADCFPTCDKFDVPNVYSHCELGFCKKTTVHKEHFSLYKKDVCNTSLTTSMEFSVSLQDTNDTTCLNGLLQDFTEQQCRNCPKTTYFLDRQCICAPGYFLDDNGKCIPELGMVDSTANYVNSSECPIKPSKLVDNKCYCRDYWFQTSNNRQCKKTTLEYTKNCMDNDWCLAMGPYAYCNDTTMKCQCNSQSTLNETTFLCVAKSDANMTDICLSDRDCPLYETCTNERCRCTEGFYRFNLSDVCLPKINSSCEVRDCTHIANARCSDITGLCECESPDDVTDGLQCLKLVNKLYDECLIEEQCKTVNHSSCLNQSEAMDNVTRCLCSQQYLDVNGTCYAKKSPGSLCNNQKDCTVILGESFICRNMLCQCPLGKSLNVAGSMCVSSSGSNSVTLLRTVAIFLLIYFL